jgi:hypothetical protein
MGAFCWGNFVANSFAKSTDDEVADREAYEQDAVLKLSEAEAKKGGDARMNDPRTDALLQNAQVNPSLQLLRLAAQPADLRGPNVQVATLLSELNKSIANNVSACALVAPFALADLMLLHSLRVLSNLSSFDCSTGSTSFMFPANSSSWRKQREIHAGPYIALQCSQATACSNG